MTTSIFRKRWWRIGIADPRQHRRIYGWKWMFGHVWWKESAGSEAMRK